MIPVIIIEGPDRSGKTTVAELVANHFGTEVFMTNSRECFADLKNDSSNLAKFNYYIAKFIENLQASDSLGKPIIIYRSFLSEMVYASLFTRKTHNQANNSTDDCFNLMNATVYLLQNKKALTYGDDFLSDSEVRRSIRLFDKYKSYVKTELIEIDTYDREVTAYVQEIINHVKTKWVTI
jgi:thymidylate kinase